MTELPPADWYEDPEDPDLYRYWDGSSWTEHRAPRHTSPPDAAQHEPVDAGLSGTHTSGLRTVGDLFSGTFSLMKKHLNLGVMYIVTSTLNSVLFVLGLYFAGDRIISGRLAEVFDRINEPDFDPSTPRNEAFFKSIEFDWSAFNVMLLVLMPLLMLTISGIVSIVTIRVIDSDLRGRATSLSEALTHAMNRLLRFIGLIAQICLLMMASVTVIVILAVAFPPLLILLVPASIAAVIAVIPIFSLSLVVASIGPQESSLLYSQRLIKGRFWAVLGRILLMFVIIAAVSTIIVSTMSALGATAGNYLFLPDLISGVLGSVLNFFFTLAVVIVYLDLGGISQDRDD